MSQELAQDKNKDQGITRRLREIVRFVIVGPEPSAAGRPTDETVQEISARHVNEGAKNGHSRAYADYIEEQQRQNMGYFMRRRYL